MSPYDTSLGTDSPVNAEVSTIEFPSVISPSIGTFSPGLTNIKSPIFTYSGFTFFMPSSVFKFAKSGFIFISSDMDFLDLSTALS